MYSVYLLRPLRKKKLPHLVRLLRKTPENAKVVDCWQPLELDHDRLFRCHLPGNFCEARPGAQIPSLPVVPRVVSDSSGLRRRESSQFPW